MMPAIEPTGGLSAACGAFDAGAQSAAQVRLSLSEINALCFKAARGSGLSWGEAEEAGWASAWLSRAGFAGPRILLQRLQHASRLEYPQIAAGRWRSPEGPLCPLRSGMALADHAGLADGPGDAAFCMEAVCHPLLVLPFAARVARHRVQPLRIGWTGAGVTVWADQAFPDAEPVRDHAEKPVDLGLEFAPGLRLRAPDLFRTTGSVGPDDWAALSALSMRVTVPPSELSRAGAGATRGDND